MGYQTVDVELLKDIFHPQLTKTKKSHLPGNFDAFALALGVPVKLRRQGHC